MPLPFLRLTGRNTGTRKSKVVTEGIMLTRQKFTGLKSLRTPRTATGLRSSEGRVIAGRNFEDCRSSSHRSGVSGSGNRGLSVCHDDNVNHVFHNVLHIDNIYHILYNVHNLHNLDDFHEFGYSSLFSYLRN